MTPKQRNQDIHDEAHAAGHAAATRTQLNPFKIVCHRSKRTYDVPDTCGFAFIHFAGNTSFGRWAKNTGLAFRSSYWGGNMISVHDYDQSMSRKSAYANAYAEVLRTHGINAYSRSQID